MSVGVRGRELRDLVHDDLFHDIHEPVAHIFTIDDFVAEAVNDLALFVHHVVEFERAFADLEIVLLDALLRLLNGTVQPGMRQSWPSSRPIRSHLFTMRSEPNSRIKIVSSEMKKWDEPGSPWRRAASAQLAVNAAGLVAFRAHDVQSAEFGDAGAEFDVRAAAGHVWWQWSPRRAGRRA